MSRAQVSALAERHRSFVFYIGAGLVATASHYVLTIVAVERYAVNAVSASSAGFALGAAVKYLLNYFLAFRSEERHRDAIPRFAATLGILFLGNALFFWALHDQAGLHYMVAQVLTTGLLIPVGYLLSRLWVFRGC